MLQIGDNAVDHRDTDKRDHRCQGASTRQSVPFEGMSCLAVFVRSVDLLRSM
jgi:hypothetical protein